MDPKQKLTLTRLASELRYVADGLDHAHSDEATRGAQARILRAMAEGLDREFGR